MILKVRAFVGHSPLLQMQLVLSLRRQLLRMLMWVC
jgi:hypothetical protein